MKFNTPRNVDVSVLSNFYPTLIQYASVSDILGSENPNKMANGNLPTAKV